jgi:hypothetical protein
VRSRACGMASISQRRIKLDVCRVGSFEDDNEMQIKY